MIRRIAPVLAAGIACSVVGAFSQVVSFNNPIAWVTQRNDSMTIRAQLDTAQIKKKEIAISVDLVNDQGKKKTLASKSFKVTDYTGEFALGLVKQNLVGGQSYLKIQWSVPGTTNKGSIEPIGIVALDKLPPSATFAVPHAKEGADIAGVVASVKESDYRAIGPTSMAMAWNKDAFYIVLVKKQTPGMLRFAFDAKNGKNAFLSFADRVVLYMPEKDSLWGTHYTRQMNGDTLKYVEKAWPNELKKSASGDKIVVRVPWYDTGIIPFEERKIGLGISATDAKGKQIAAVPASAEFFLPGTWGEILLAK